MNYLAHVLLAGEPEEARIGGLLGDFVKGDPSGRFPPVMAREIYVHRRLDAYTDAHPVFREARQHFPPQQRRFAGLVLDVFFDHALARSWAQWCDMPLAAFTAAFYGSLQRHHDLLPERLQHILPALIQHDWLAAYGEMENVRYALRRMAERRMKRGDGLLACLEDLDRAYSQLLPAFQNLFPDLQAHAVSVRRGAELA